MTRRECLWLLPLLLLPAVPLRAADAPAGKVVYSRKDGDRFLLHVMKPDGTDDHLLPGQTANVNLFPCWSPDGKQIAFMSGAKADMNEFQVSIINEDGTGLKTLNVPDKMAAVPAWSPDGKQLAITVGQMEPTVAVLDVDGGGYHQVSPQGQLAVFPFWMPDGKRLGFTVIPKGDEKQGEIEIVKLEGGEPESVLKTDRIPLVGANGASSDGKRLLFAGIDIPTKKASFQILDLSTKGQTVLTDDQVAQQGGPEGFLTGSWFPDGKAVLVGISSDKGTSLYRVSEDGDTKTRLTPEGAACYCPALWSPRP